MKNLWKSYFKPTPKKVAQLLLGAKAVLGTIAGTEMAMGNPKIAFWIMVFIGVLNEFANFLSSPSDDSNTNK